MLIQPTLSAARPRWLSAAFLVVIVLLIVLVGLPTSPDVVPATSPALPQVRSALKQLPLAFVSNEGQRATDVRFQTGALGSSLSFAPNEIVLKLPGIGEGNQTSFQSLRLQFLGANPAPTIEAGRLLPGVINWYRPDGAVTNVPTYAGIHYRTLYPGIDLRYDGIERALKSTFVVAPGADPSLIRWQYTGAEAVAIDQVSGNLHVTLPDGSQIVEQAPVAWQEIDGRRTPVAASYSLDSQGNVAFALGAYNAARPLIIDPTIVYETVLDFGGSETGNAIAIDDDGNAYVTAYAYLDDSFSDLDVVVAKLGPDGTLLYTTYLQGSEHDTAWDIELDSAGDILIAGLTDSPDFPILNALDPTKNGVTRDGFLTKLSASDGTLVFSTFFGGSRSDEIAALVLNDADEIYLTGYTESTDFPVTPDAIQDELNLTHCFCADAFVSKISADGQTVLYGTYLGGSFRDHGRSIGLDDNNNIYFAGRTRSDDFPLHNPIQPLMGGGEYDGFITRISADGSSLDYSTYLGGEDSDLLERLAVDGAGNAFVAGSTLSADFPTTPGAYQETFVGGILACEIPFGQDRNCYDFFVTKLLPDGSALAYSTFIGGLKDDEADDIAVTGSGEALIAGYTDSDDFPPDGSDGFDIVLAKLSADGSDLLYALDIFSPVANSAHGVALDGVGDIYVTGAQNVPHDLYVVKITEIDQATTHVGDLDGGSRLVGSEWQAGVRVQVHDQNENPLGGAVVEVSGMTDTGIGPVSRTCTTDAAGRCIIATPLLPVTIGSVTFTVEDITLDGYAYDGSDNHDPDGDSDGTTITVTQPN